MTALLIAEQAFRELGERQKRTQESGVSLGEYCRWLELRDFDHKTVAEFYRYARERIGQ